MLVDRDKFRFAYEEIRSADDTEVTFIGVWLFIFDPTHSTAELLKEVMQINHGLLVSQGAASQNPNMRHKGYQNEIERRKKSGYSFSSINNNFESTVGMQHWRIVSMESYRQMLESHSGKSTHSEGRPFVENPSAHQDNAMGRKYMCGDTAFNHGSFHPIAPEFVFNAKRKEGLAFGAVALDGKPGNIHEKYLDPASYWEGDTFKIPQGCDMWVCSEIERLTIMDCPLPRPLQNQVTPGDSLMRLFIERMKPAAGEAGPAEESARDIALRMRRQGQGQAQGNGQTLPMDVEGSGMASGMAASSSSSVFDPPLPEPPITSNDYARFRSFASGVDEKQRRDTEEIRSILQRFDNMDALLSSSDTSLHRGSKKDSFRIKIEKMTDIIAGESNEVYDKLIQPWFAEAKKRIDDDYAYLEKTRADCEDHRWDEVRVREKDMYQRFYDVKSDLSRYHLRSTFQCFHSAHDLATLPNGYIAMVNELEKHVDLNGGSASMAFPPPHKDGTLRLGKQITASDRQVWHELQEWLGVIFTKDAHIRGRDRFIMMSATPAKNTYARALALASAHSTPTKSNHASIFESPVSTTRCTCRALTCTRTSDS